MTTETKQQDAPKDTSKNTPKDTQYQKNNDTNIYRLSAKTPFGKGMSVANIIIQKHGGIQLESLGTATSVASRVAQTLAKHGYASIKSIRSEQFSDAEDEKK